MLATTPLHLHRRFTESMVSASADGPGFRVLAQRQGSALMLQVGGDIDARNVGQWRSLLNAAAAAGSPGSLMIDLEQLDFMALCGYAALAECARRCRDLGGALHLISSRPAVERVITACRWPELLPVHRTLQGALDAHP